MLTSSRRHEKLAERFDEIASALDAGLDVRAVLSGPATAGLRGRIETGLPLVEALQVRGLELGELDRQVLGAAERAGDMPDALRERADAHRTQAELARELVARLAYPAFLLCAATTLIGFLHWLGMSRIGTPAMIAWLASVTVAAVALSWFVRGVRKSPDFRWRRAGFLAPLVRDAGELPYLSAMRGLYAAGVLLPEAHAIAARACPIASTRRRLDAATDSLRRGIGFVHALSSSDALCEETIRLLSSGETTGELEASLRRAANRRNDTFKTRLRRTVRALGAVAYVLAAATVAWVVFDFYGTLYSRLGR
jgi:type II secretory pathway component PulF